MYGIGQPYLFCTFPSIPLADLPHASAAPPSLAPPNDLTPPLVAVVHRSPDHDLDLRPPSGEGGQTRSLYHQGEGGWVWRCVYLGSGLLFLSLVHSDF